eukprot:TRINITY_DN54993_c0_g1_i1.p1 TRINITY_DN54993_c0_g1~~TRINITY_DN54993_c0_g1_i1.p1  ORF type:complete len:133 (+),score=35.03 TRINITY_DN54993_c0_g1_i1:78-476(+)
MRRRPPRSTQGVSSAASDVYKRQYQRRVHGILMVFEQTLGYARKVWLEKWRNKKNYLIKIGSLFFLYISTSPLQKVIRRITMGLCFCLSLIHISEPTRPLYISYAVFCLKKKKNTSLIILSKQCGIKNQDND